MYPNSTYTVLPLHWGSRDIWLADWIALLTIGLAPLIVHILSGAPQPSYICHERPKWHDRICTLNPISILWRYAAITDRRILSRNWGTREFAASNAVFWTSRGWDGSEAMISQSLPYTIHLPEKATVRIFSMEMLRTVIALLQGIQALAAIIGNMTSTGDYTTMDNVSGLFMPIAMCGLLRMCAAPWLTDDFIFSIGNGGNNLNDHNERLPDVKLTTSCDKQALSADSTSNSLRSWGSLSFRIFCVINFLGFWCLGLLFITPWVGIYGWVGIWTTTAWLLGIYYMALITPLNFIMGYYFLRGPLTTTLIPCISKWWYKAYTIFFAVFTVVLVAIAAIETRKTVCGKYSTLATQYWDPCAIGDLRVLRLGFESSEGFGVAQNLNGSGQFVVANFTGQCLGVPMPPDEWQKAMML